MPIHRGVAFTTAIAVAVASLQPSHADAAPDPLIASMLSLGSTLVPIGVSGVLFFTGNGTDENVRFDLGLTTLALGAILGPSIGQVYAHGGVDAWVAFFLRLITGGIMVAGTGLAFRGTGDGQTAGIALAILGAVPTAFLAGWDIFGAASAAKAQRYQEGHALSPPGWMVREACLEASNSE
jgi:hypothetical protein